MTSSQQNIENERNAIAGCPASAKHLGYVLHFLDNDSFLSITMQAGNLVKSFCDLPDNAHVFNDVNEAVTAAFEISQSSVVCAIFVKNGRFYTVFS